MVAAAPRVWRCDAMRRCAGGAVKAGWREGVPCAFLAGRCVVVCMAVLAEPGRGQAAGSTDRCLWPAVLACLARLGVVACWASSTLGVPQLAGTGTIQPARREAKEREGKALPRT